MVTWLLAYLLAGFFLQWTGARLFGIHSVMDWREELVCILIWPIALLVGVYVEIKEELRVRKK